ncbi:MerR family transcriptional regulator [Actinacidiphila sp. bgisy160]|uniref:MerR family transcriptional regulator n=1 Tax=Actinacidiphila sp. bgisy160 TaxID=3413796 RepID=UPI003D719B7A
MDDDTLYTIGELARLTGLTVKTIRYWSDTGVVPPTDRTPAGYRLYDRAALDRLALVRTLRDLGIDLASVHSILDSKVTVAEVAAAHAEALEVQIRMLRIRQTVLRTVAGRGASPQETELMHRLATLSERERRRLVDEFVDHIVSGIDVDPGFPAMMRAAMPELPDDAAPEQVGAWVELAELIQDEEFRAGVRRAVADQSRALAEGGQPDPAAARRTAELLRERAGGAVAAGVDPASASARPVVEELVGVYAQLSGRADGPEFRAWLAERLEISHDSRYERYWQLLAQVAGQDAPPALAPAVAWLTAALRA